MKGTAGVRRKPCQASTGQRGHPQAEAPTVGNSGGRQQLLSQDYSGLGAHLRGEAGERAQPSTEARARRRPHTGTSSTFLTVPLRVLPSGRSKQSPAGRGRQGAGTGVSVGR